MGRDRSRERGSREKRRSPSGSPPRRHRRERSEEEKSRSGSPVRKRRVSRSPASRSPPPQRSRHRSRSRGGSRDKRSRSRGRYSRSRSPRYKGYRQENKKESRCIALFNLSYRIDEEELRHEFKKYGEIENIKIVCNRRRAAIGFAFITFETVDDAVYAKKKMHGKALDGKEIRIDFSMTDGNRSSYNRGGFNRGGRSRSGSREKYRRGRSDSREKYKGRRSDSREHKRRRSPSYSRRSRSDSR